MGLSVESLEALIKLQSAEAGGLKAHNSNLLAKNCDLHNKNVGLVAAVRDARAKLRDIEDRMRAAKDERDSWQVEAGKFKVQRDHARSELEKAAQALADLSLSSRETANEVAETFKKLQGRWTGAIDVIKALVHVCPGGSIKDIAKGYLDDAARLLNPAVTVGVDLAAEGGDKTVAVALRKDDSGEVAIADLATIEPITFHVALDEGDDIDGGLLEESRARWEAKAKATAPSAGIDLGRARSAPLGGSDWREPDRLRWVHGSGVWRDLGDDGGFAAPHAEPNRLPPFELRWVHGMSTSGVSPRWLEYRCAGGDWGKVPTASVVTDPGDAGEVLAKSTGSEWRPSK